MDFHSDVLDNCMCEHAFKLGYTHIVHNGIRYKINEDAECKGLYLWYDGVGLIDENRSQF
jgi:hypothetical protein